MLQKTYKNPYKYYSIFPTLSKTLLDDSFYNWSTLKSERWEKTDNGYELTIEIPGFGKEDVEMKIKENILRISIADNQNYSYKLSNKHDLQNISATADKGILTVHIPFKEEENVNEIEIKVD